jgi:hypothetical protein
VGADRASAKASQKRHRTRAAPLVRAKIAEAARIALQKTSARRPLLSGFRLPPLKADCRADGAAVVYDAQRAAYLNSRRYCVLRFWNCDVLENCDGVVEIIAAAAKPPTRPALPGDLPA